MTSLAARGGRVTEKAGSYFPGLPTSGIEPEDVDRMSEVDKVREASSEATPLKRNHTPSKATITSQLMEKQTAQSLPLDGGGS